MLYVACYLSFYCVNFAVILFCFSGMESVSMVIYHVPAQLIAPIDRLKIPNYAAELDGHHFYSRFDHQRKRYDRHQYRLLDEYDLP
jgi:hypothetical protein